MTIDEIKTIIKRDEALFKTGFLESWGTGVGRMIDACKNVGLPEPEYGTDGLFVWITFMRPNSDSRSVTNSVTNSVTDSDSRSDSNSDSRSDSNSDTQLLSDRQKEVLAYCMIERSSREILEHIHVKYHNWTINKFINELVDVGLLERTIPDSPNHPRQKYIAKKK